MKFEPFNRPAAGLTIAVSMAALVLGCDEDPSFVVAEANAPLQSERDLDAQAVTPQDQQKPQVIIDSGPDSIPDPIRDIESNLTLTTLERELSAGVIADGDMEFSIDELLQETRYQMFRRQNEASRTFQQITRPRPMETFKQGADGSQHIDNFEQNSNAQWPLSIFS